MTVNVRSIKAKNDPTSFCSDWVGDKMSAGESFLEAFKPFWRLLKLPTKEYF